METSWAHFIPSIWFSISSPTGSDSFSDKLSLDVSHCKTQKFFSTSIIISGILFSLYPCTFLLFSMLFSKSRIGWSIFLLMKKDKRMSLKVYWKVIDTILSYVFLSMNTILCFWEFFWNCYWYQSFEDKNMWKEIEIMRNIDAIVNKLKRNFDNWYALFE